MEAAPSGVFARGSIAPATGDSRTPSAGRGGTSIS
jgi:hypothetical protein